MPRKPEEPSAKKAEGKKSARRADYQGATPEKVAEAVLRYRPPSEGPKPKQDKRWL